MFPNFVGWVLIYLLYIFFLTIQLLHHQVIAHCLIWSVTTEIVSSSYHGAMEDLIVQMAAMSPDAGVSM